MSRCYNILILKSVIRIPAKILSLIHAFELTIVCIDFGRLANTVRQVVIYYLCGIVASYMKNQCTVLRY